MRLCASRAEVSGGYGYPAVCASQAGEHLFHRLLCDDLRAELTEWGI
jgi:hypothetical protein